MMNGSRVTQISKFLCKFLRHSPEKLGITLDSEGCAKVWLINTN